jgi:hypothetical protein
VAYLIPLYVNLSVRRFDTALPIAQQQIPPSNRLDYLDQRGLRIGVVTCPTFVPVGLISVTLRSFFVAAVAEADRADAYKRT